MQSYSFKHIASRNINEFIEITEMYYANNDVYHKEEPVIRANHSHKTQESRLILSGKCYFTIHNETIECNPGDYITIKPEIVHSFAYYGGEPLRVMRFSQER
jgi:cupin superfamily acireductone dioxygenase involved in methionine salvage